ncbi:Uncharacterised protein [Serratia fonticola]|uniref:hypothetical protein n=1 Tax=Serratia fonticola TaxID=47917 RepID=UPI00217961F6|nr:hypothetical protein [Serratia fonticola]CAI1702949.1 Uncharacterised protein [Serratia fonticola]
MKEENVLERFKRDTRNHSMTVENDNGIFRHLHFSRGNSSSYHFTLTTWPGHLCIGGDMGTYVFRRLHDMFKFFRMDHSDYQRHGDDPVINAGYWSEKLQTGGGFRREVYTEWSSTAFENQVQEQYDQWLEEFDPDDYEGDAETIKAEVKEAIDSLKGESEDEWSAVAAIREFYSDHIDMCDFWESDSCRRASFHYLWCLYAIVWGIQLYDRRNLVNSAMDKFFVYQLEAV